MWKFFTFLKLERKYKLKDKVFNEYLINPIFIKPKDKLKKLISPTAINRLRKDTCKGHILVSPKNVIVCQCGVCTARMEQA